MLGSLAEIDDILNTTSALYEIGVAMEPQNTEPSMVIRFSCIVLGCEDDPRFK